MGVLREGGFPAGLRLSGSFTADPTAEPALKVIREHLSSAESALRTVENSMIAAQSEIQAAQTKYADLKSNRVQLESEVRAFKRVLQQLGYGQGASF